MNKRSDSKPVRVIGLISGTSADGIDAAVVEFSGAAARPGVKLIAFRTYPYPDALRKRILEACDPATGTVDRICHLDAELGEWFARAALAVAEEAGFAPREIDLIGSHGQTIYHRPEPAPCVAADGAWAAGIPERIRSTLQVGQPAVIAERTGITTVAGFRPRDVAAGGHGAPLVPLADLLLFGDAREGRAVQNIGGIANVTYIPPGADPAKVLAFDTGPGNMMIDAAASLVSGGRLRYDVDGALARAGHVSQDLLEELMRHPYLRLPPPKTTGREEFGIPLVAELYGRWGGRLSAEDFVATLTAFTAASIADAYASFVTPRGRLDRVLISGGGARNPALVAELRRRLHPVPIQHTAAAGLPGEAKEAVAFALFAYLAAFGLPNNLPAATGASRAVVMGCVVPGGGYAGLYGRSGSEGSDRHRA